MPSKEKTQGGSVVHRYGEPTNTELTAPVTRYLEEVSAHLERHIGTASTVLHELVSPVVHIDVLIVPPSERRPCLTLVTSGMSDLPMAVPETVEDAANLRRLELMISLPAHWIEQYPYFSTYQVTEGSEEGYYPVGYLKYLARFPHEYGTWLGNWHTLPNGDPPAPLDPDTEMTGFLLMPPMTLPEDAWSVRAGDGELINFLAIYPLHTDEMNFKLRQGPDALLERLGNAGVTDVFDPKRTSAVPRMKRFGLF